MDFSNTLGAEAKSFPHMFKLAWLAGKEIKWSTRVPQRQWAEAEKVLSTDFPYDYRMYIEMATEIDNGEVPADLDFKVVRLIDELRCR